MDIISFAEELNDLIEENRYLRQRVHHLEEMVDIHHSHMQQMEEINKNSMAEIFSALLGKEEPNK